MAMALGVASLPAQALAGVRAKAVRGGSSLTIVGDSKANDVAVILNDAGDAIEVSSGGQPVGSFADGPVESIRVRLGGGDDFANLNADPAVAMVVSGGPGDDTVSGQVSNDGFRSVEHVVTFVALINNGGSLGYNCRKGVCECDKSIENDCELMSWECTWASLPDFSTCLKGWLTTHCECKQSAIVRDPGLIFLPIVNINGGILTR